MQLIKKLLLSIALLLTTTLWASEQPLGKPGQAETLRVCIWPEYYSISYRDPRTLQLSGIDIDLARALASDLGLILEFVDSSFSNLIEDLNQGQCDIAMFGIGVTAKREQQVAFSQPYLHSDMVAVTTCSNRRIINWEDLDRPGNVVAVARGSMYEFQLAERFQHAVLSVHNSTYSRTQAVLSGRADAFVTDYPYSLRMLATTHWARLVKPQEPYHLNYYAWAVKQGNADWLAQVNQFLQNVRQDGRLLAAARAHNLEPIVVME